MRRTHSINRCTAFDNLVVHHVQTCGPCSFASIVAYAKEQWQAEVLEWEVAASINRLTRAHIIHLYDTGDSWDMGDGCSAA